MQIGESAHRDRVYKYALAARTDEVGEQRWDLMGIIVQNECTMQF